MSKVPVVGRSLLLGQSEMTQKRWVGQDHTGHMAYLFYSIRKPLKEISRMREEGRWVTIRFSFPQGNYLYCDQHLVGELESM